MKKLYEEQSFHDKRFSGDDCERVTAGKYYSVFVGINKKTLEFLTKYCQEKKILEFGCGNGFFSEKLLLLNAQLSFIDISSVAIQNLKNWIKKTGYKADYFVMDAEKTGFHSDTFDVIFGCGIIHHLDISNAYSEISRLLRKNGHAIFLEPLGHNPFINIYRKITPEMRTLHEHPLKMKDLQLLKKSFLNVDFQFFSLFTLLAVPFRKKPFFLHLYNFLESIDKAVFEMPFLKRYAWTVLIHVSHPKKSVVSG